MNFLTLIELGTNQGHETSPWTSHCHETSPWTSHCHETSALTG